MYNKNLKIYLKVFNDEIIDLFDFINVYKRPCYGGKLLQPRRSRSRARHTHP